jgi:class 3 adenylate cyclase
MQATLTVLFTDAVASTEALGRLGDERFGVVQQEHLDLLRGPVGACDGREVKSLGDGLMAAFTGAADALACAVAMQQAIEAAGRGGEEGLPLRVGVSSGDVAGFSGTNLGPCQRPRPRSDLGARFDSRFLAIGVSGRAVFRE